MKKILVTGSSGTIGTALCIELLKKGYDVIGADLKPNEWDSKVDEHTLVSDLLVTPLLGIIFKDLKHPPFLDSAYNWRHKSNFISNCYGIYIKILNELSKVCPPHCPYTFIFLVPTLAVERLLSFWYATNDFNIPILVRIPISTYRYQ